MKAASKKYQIILIHILFISNFFNVFNVFAGNISPLSDKYALKKVEILDDRQHHSGDYKSNCFVKEVEKGKDPKIFQATVYRRSSDNKFLLMFNKPKTEAGKGYLKIEKNLWMYDPITGKWERRTEREKIGGSNSRRSDFDESKLAKEYNVKFESVDKLGDFDAYKLSLLVKEGVDVAYPKLMIWIDKENNNELKREEYSLSGKLMRTSYYPSWVKEFSKSKKDYVWIPKEIRIFDNLEKGNSTTIVITDSDLNNLPENIFTKAWVEQQSR
ncbi:MAG: outer membrane lipoprotein-sorting protein [Oligoflexia bacterium]|nr:outer membrane lipoprotein-sorting protein [Oligoflexia bacterium]